MYLQQEQILLVLNKVLKQSPRLRKGGSQAMYYCPLCNHHKRKLEVNLNEGKYHCWICNLGGLNFNTLLKKLNAPTKYYELLGEPVKIKNKDILDELKNSYDTVDDFKIYSLPTEFISLIEKNNTIPYKHAINYLNIRGVTKFDIYRYNIGYCDAGEYKNRIVIPSYDLDGNLNFFSTRDFFNNSKLKYINSGYNKNIIGFESLINFDEQVTLVEGAFDAIATKINCIPLFGKFLSEKLKLKLIETRPPCVNIVLDNDASCDAIKICEILIRHDINVKLVKLNEKDPSILGFKKTWDYINQTEFLSFEELFQIKLNL